MSTTMLRDIPLLGALCIAAGLISQAHLARCLELQAHMYPGTTIGRVMVLQGYCTEPDIARMVAQQQAFRRDFCAAIDHTSQPPVERVPAAEPVRNVDFITPDFLDPTVWRHNSIAVGTYQRRSASWF